MTTSRKNKFSRWKIALGLLLFFLIAAAALHVFLFRRAEPVRPIDRIMRSGVLRVLTTPESDLRGLQRGVTPLDTEFAMLDAFAEELNVSLQMVYVATFDELAVALRAGRGDLIADNLTITPEREKQFLFTRPFTSTRNVLVTRVDVRELPLRPKLVAVAGSLHEKMLQTYPDSIRTALPRQPEELLAMVADGEYDAAITDDNFLRGYLRYRNDVHVAALLGERNGIGWALRPGSDVLKKKLDDFIARRGRFFRDDASTEDLDGIRRKKMLRVLTRDNPVNYYTERGESFGFEYAMAKRFADSQNLRLVMVTPPMHQDLIPYLIAGRGDLIAACMSITPERAAEKRVAFSAPYLETREVIVQRGDAAPVKVLSDLNGRVVSVRESSSVTETLRRLLKGGAKFQLRFVSPDVESVEIPGMIAEGQLDCTLIDELLARNARKNGVENISLQLPLGEVRRYAWLVRSDNPQLRKAVDSFLERDMRSPEFKASYDEFFGSGVAEPELQPEIQPAEKRISQYDNLIKSIAENFYFDWLLIAAQVCQESRFRADVTAPDGGKGLLQLMPVTIREMRCRDPFDPRQNLEAGVGYLARQRDRLDREVKTLDRIYFALASYNGGYGHLSDARRLAAELKKNPDVWFDNVEHAMKLLSRKTYYDKTRYGYCRSDIIVRYVREIRNRFEQYRAQGVK